MGHESLDKRNVSSLVRSTNGRYRLSSSRRSRSTRCGPVPRELQIPDMMMRQPTITTTHPMDVLFGYASGNGDDAFHSHVGNRLYHQLVEYNKPIYRSLRSKQRACVTHTIVQAILKTGGRFLQQQPRQLYWHYERENEDDDLDDYDDNNNNNAQESTITWIEMPVVQAILKTQLLLQEPENKAMSSLIVREASERTNGDIAQSINEHASSSSSIEEASSNNSTEQVSSNNSTEQASTNNFTEQASKNNTTEAAFKNNTTKNTRRNNCDDAKPSNHNSTQNTSSIVCGVVKPLLTAKNNNEELHRKSEESDVISTTSRTTTSSSELEEDMAQVSSQSHRTTTRRHPQACSPILRSTTPSFPQTPPTKVVKHQRKVSFDLRNITKQYDDSPSKDTVSAATSATQSTESSRSSSSSDEEEDHHHLIKSVESVSVASTQPTVRHRNHNLTNLLHHPHNNHMLGGFRCGLPHGLALPPASSFLKLWGLQRPSRKLLTAEKVDDSSVRPTSRIQPVVETNGQSSNTILVGHW